MFSSRASRQVEPESEYIAEMPKYWQTGLNDVNTYKPITDTELTSLARFFRSCYATAPLKPLGAGIGTVPGGVRNYQVAAPLKLLKFLGRVVGRVHHSATIKLRPH